MTELTHEEKCIIADVISQPPYDPSDYLSDDPGLRDSRKTTLSLGFLRGCRELQERGYKIVNGESE
jgi:hypothetical protein